MYPHSFDVYDFIFIRNGSQPRRVSPGETRDNECGQKEARIQVGLDTKAKLMR